MAALCDILSSLPNVRDLSLAGLEIGRSEVQLFNSLPKSLERVTLHRVRLQSTGAFPFLWSQLPRLRSCIAIECIWVSSPNVPAEYRDVSFSPSFVNLQLSADIQHCDALLDWLSTHNLAKQLRMFSLNVGDTQLIPSVARLLHAFGPSLEILEICPAVRDDDIEGAASAREYLYVFHHVHIAEGSCGP